MSGSGGPNRLGPALLVALIAASLAAGIYVYRERTPDLALEVPKLDRVLGHGKNGETPVEFEFFVRFDETDATVQIVGQGDEPARDLGAGVALRADERVACSWDGRDDEGEEVEPGNYRLRVELPSEGRDMVFPLRIAVRENARIGPEVPEPLCRRETGAPLE